MASFPDQGRSGYGAREGIIRSGHRDGESDPYDSFS